MPELPEVETVRCGLLPFAQGATIRAMTLNRADLRRPIPPDLPHKVTGREITSITRHGKTLLWHIKDGPILAWHLGMSGSFRAGLASSSIDIDSRKHDHIEIKTDKGAHIIFNDPRRFGALGYAPAHMAGIDPLGRVYTIENFIKLFRAKATSIKAALLDQTLLAGIGNIYACEALFQAGIHPQRLCQSLSLEELNALFEAITRVLHSAIASGGSSLRDHVMVNGQAGKFQHEFFVYGRSKAPCHACAQPIMQIKQNGRSSFFCASCQG